MNAIFAKRPRRHFQVENSVPLRVVSTAMALTGVVTAMQLTECPWWLALLSIIGCVLGSYVSHLRRNSNNFVVKIWISVGIMIVAYLFFNELVLLANANIADARVPLTKLLMALIALHCFDLPRRRDLSVSALVGVTLMTVASTLSRDLFYSWFLAGFMLLSVCMFQLDCASRSLSRAKLWAPLTENEVEPLLPAEIGTRKNEPSQSFRKQDIWLVIPCSAVVLAATFVCFAFLPRIHISLQQLKFSGSLPYQLKMLPGQLPSLNGDGSVISSSKAYYGFSEELDTNYRGGLGDEVVLRVSSNNGTYLRGMAYDNFDGRVWRMSHPKQVTDQAAAADNCFYLTTGRQLSSHVRIKTVTQEIFVEQDGSNLVVCASCPYQIYFPSSNLKIDTYGSIRSPVGVKKDMVYTVFSHVPMFDFASMRNLPAPSEKERAKVAAMHADFLQLPSQLSPQVSRLAEQIGGKGNNYAQAERISNYLQTHLSYDLNAEPSPSGTDTVSDFLLRKKRGSCEHFASALVLMCRTLGIPAMLVTGYQPGSYNPFTGLWDVHLNEAHSWVEVYVRKYGWVPLDPTPNSLMGQPYQEPQSVLSYLAQVLDPLWQKLRDSAVSQALAKTLHNAFGSLSLSWLGFTGYFPQLLGIAVIGAVLVSAAAFVWQFKFQGLNIFKHKSGPLKERQLSMAEATNEFMAVSRSLKYIGVERRQSETAADLLARVRESMAEKRMESREYLNSLESFLNLYSRLRFGFGAEPDLERLKQLGRALDKMAVDLSKQRKTVGIS